MADADSPTPLATFAQLQEGPFADLVSGYTTSSVQTDLMTEATRLCESECGRRLAPFTSIQESHRAEGIDPDEYADSANLPMDLQGTLGRSYAYALGASTLVRHFWCNEYAARYPDLWSYSNTSITIVRSYGGSEVITSSQITGPDTDSGHVWFQLGTFLPIGSYIYVTYSGGYTTVPGDLVRACKLMAAWLAVSELNPNSTDHDPEKLHTDALMLLSNYERA